MSVRHNTAMIKRKNIHSLGNEPSNEDRYKIKKKSNTVSENNIIAKETQYASKNGIQKWKNSNHSNEDVISSEIKEEHFQKIVKHVKLQRIQENIKNLQDETVRHMTNQVSALLDGIVGELERFNDDRDDELFGGEVIRRRREQDRNIEKRFISRPSPLSELMEVRHFRSLYHMCIAGLIIVMLNGILGDVLSEGWRSIHLGVRHVPAAFAKLNKVILIWITMFSIACSMHPILNFWAKTRSILGPKNSWNRWIWNRLCGWSFFAFMIIFLVVTALVLDSKMGPISSVVVLLENVRFMMKMHAFVRSNVLKMDDKNFKLSFSNYLYFLFAPTLVYRDEYPRTPQIRWRFLAGCLVEFFGVVLMQSCIFEFNLYPEFNSFGLRPHTPGTLAASIFRTVLPATLLVVSGFYLLLHAWMNIWAEVLRFADRRFYGAWWNATSYGEYYRTWNCVVHDYLRTYIYKDTRIITGSKIAGHWAVFAVSAFIHEWIIAYMLGFCYPVMFIQFFGLGATLGLLNSAGGSGTAENIFLWASLAYGTGIQLSLYSMESFSRINCPKDYEGVWDYFVPRSWTCNGLDLTGTDEFFSNLLTYSENPLEGA